VCNQFQNTEVREIGQVGTEVRMNTFVVVTQPDVGPPLLADGKEISEAIKLPTSRP
jgi:hypothetical protein